MRALRILFCLTLMLGLSGPVLAADEVRVLIDVSGSMKENDPNNLRAPALRLLVNLLPPESRAGVWSFAQYVNPLVRPAAISEDWRRGALHASEQIHSRGLFTDIGAALEAATADWQERDPNSRRSLVLLTDGIVDVSKTPGANASARQRVLDEILPRLRAAGVHVHTVALSGGADQALLRELSLSTDGAFETAASAEELQRIFLRLFEKAVERDTVPLEGNRFQVDGSIDELTLLAFRKAGAPPAELAMPDGTRFGASNAPAQVRWHEEGGYDLVTVEHPAPGEWTLVADVDPDNRVMIVTDLKLEASKLPNNLLLGEEVLLTVTLTEGGEVITRQDFLKMSEVSVTQQPAQGSERSWSLQDNGLGADQAGGDGRYNLELGQTLTPGEQALLVNVEGKTFKRQLRRSVKVFESPLAVETHAQEDGAGHEIVLRQVLDWVDSDSLKVGAQITNDAGAARQLTMDPDTEGNWRLAVPAAEGRTTVQLEVAGRTVDGRPFHLRLAPVEFAPGAPAEPEQPPAESAPPVTKSASINWLLVGGIVTVANLALFGIIAIIYALIRQRRVQVPEFADAEAEGEPAPEQT